MPLDQVVERMLLDRPQPEEGRARRLHPGPVDRESLSARLGERVSGDLLLAGATLATHRLVLDADIGRERRSSLGVDEGGGHPDRAGRVRDVDDRSVVVRLDLDGGVRP